MSAAMRDVVTVHVSADLPVRVHALPFADRVEIRLGKAFPVALVVDRAALPRFIGALSQGAESLTAADQHREDRR